MKSSCVLSFEKHFVVVIVLTFVIGTNLFELTFKECNMITANWVIISYFEAYFILVNILDEQLKTVIPYWSRSSSILNACLDHLFIICDNNIWVHLTHHVVIMQELSLDYFDFGFATCRFIFHNVISY